MTKLRKPRKVETGVQPKRTKRRVNWMTYAEFAKKSGAATAAETVGEGWVAVGRLSWTVYTDDFVELRIAVKSRSDASIRATRVLSWQGDKGQGAA